MLQSALAQVESASAWPIFTNWRLPRINCRIDAIILAPRAIIVCLLREGRTHTKRNRIAVEDAALDVHDFHSASRLHPVVPLLITADAVHSDGSRPLLLPGVTPVVEASATTLVATLRDLAQAPLCDKLDAHSWQEAAYRPIPSLIEAARMLYARHGVADIAASHATAENLRATRTAITHAVNRAAEDRRPTVVFVTGIPGAGKTLCGLDATFAGNAAFLTGNPSLVHVLREALARDAGGSLRAARQRMEAVIQPLPAFRDHYAAVGTPPERVIIIDEAQRCWSAAHAMRKTAKRPVRLLQSEPAHLLDIMQRRDDGPVIIALTGGGQEIHAGEGGLAEWGDALKSRPNWRVEAGPETLDDPVQRRRLPRLPRLELDARLHLSVPVRSLRSAAAPDWVDAVLAGNAGRASILAAEGVPFSVTRDLDTMRARLRCACRGSRRAGLLASAEAKRLRAEGLGAILPHDDPGAVARWFLNRFPDVRASDALEVAATEFFVQGLEVDAAGLCWDGDLIRQNGQWQARRFRGTGWTSPRSTEVLDNRLNAYRVLLTRARYETVIWVPRGDAQDSSRDPATLDAVAAFLLSCGASKLG